MLLVVGVPKGFYGLNFKTPQEIWTGKAPSLIHLQVFGCSAYAHVRQDKLEPRAKKCIFLGYPEGVKGYKYWCIEEGSKKVIISRDVTLNELEMPLLKKEIHNTLNSSEKPDIEVLSQ